jgi:4-amino-4-deoxy-L-arabinose transferase-like glycosyltransferase
MADANSIPEHSSAGNWAALNGWLQANPLRALLVFIGAQILIWTLVPWALGWSLPLDVVCEGLSWGHEWQWGYYKHPPLPSWEAEVAFDLLGDIGPYLLSQISVGVTYLFVYLLGRRMMPAPYALAGTVLLAGVYYFSIPTPQFNHNIAQMPLWAAAAYFYYRSLETRTLGSWTLLGLTIGLGMLTKYSTAMLAAAIIFYALSARSTRNIFASAGPYLAILVCLVVMTPHLIWLVHNNFPTLNFVVHRAGHTVAIHRLLTPLTFLAAQLAALLPCLTVAAIAGIVGRGSFRELPTWRDDNLRFLIVLGLGPALLAAFLSLASGLGLYDEWGTTMWNLTGLLLVYASKPWWENISFPRLFLCVAALFVAMPVAYAIAETYGPEWRGAHPRTQWPDRAMAQRLSAAWTRTTGRKLEVVAGAPWLAGLIALRSEPRPSVFTDANFREALWLSPAKVRESGTLVVWQVSKQTPLPPANLMLPGLQMMGTMDFMWPYSNKIEPLHIGWGIVPPIQSAPPAGR